MNCEEVLGLLDALVDNELSAREKQTVMAHIGACPDCEAELEELTELGLKLQQIPRHIAPVSLTQKIRSDLAQSTALPFTLTRQRALSVLTHTGAAMVGGVILYAVLLQQITPRPVSSAIVAAHITSLKTDNLLQVASSDTHRVKPWFIGKLDFAPPVHDFAKQGYRLLGGRIDMIADQKFAALVYQRREHRINLFIAPVSQTLPAKMVSDQYKGFNILSHQGRLFIYRAISDIDQNELETLISMITKKTFDNNGP